MSTDTIAAISTAPGRAAIAVIRLSGPEAVEIAAKTYRGQESLNRLPSHSVRYGKVFNRSGEHIDEVLLSVMRGPESYTGEDVVEISCHGGLLVSQLVLDALIEAGARLAEPGEFTKRAFLNNKMDLAQAEAVAEIVGARTRLALERALNQLGGGVSEELRQLRASIIEVLAEVEARIDFPEDVTDALDSVGLSASLGTALSRLESLVSERARSALLSAGARVPIVGRPNVGKSSLLNSLVGHSRAIVNPEPGTTRDTIEDEIDIEGIPVRLIDTAGLRSAREEVEEQGVKRSRDEITRADVVLYVVDASAENHAADLQILESIAAKMVIVAVNKVDIASPIKAESALEKQVAQINAAEVSAKNGTGIESLKKTLAGAVLGCHPDVGEARCASERHLASLRAAILSVHNAASALEQGSSDEVAAFELRDAAEQLGAITGESVGPDVLDAIFSRFCVGK